MKPYNLLMIDTLSDEEIISRIQGLYFKNAEPKKAFQYSQKLNNMPREQMIVELAKNFNDLVILTENENLQNMIAEHF